MSVRSFRGVVVPGRGLGAGRMSSASVQRAISRITDLGIVPGTLNVRLPEPFDARLEGYMRWEEFGRMIPDPDVPGRKGIRYGEVIIAGRFRGLVFQGDEPEYPGNQVELISDHHLRDALGLLDGDAIEFTLAREVAMGD